MKGIRRATWYGSKWCRRETRLAIYLRDGVACVWCQRSYEPGMVFTLDHVLPHSRNGGGHYTNLVTACKSCNFARADRSVALFSRITSLKTGEEPESIVRRVRNVRRRKMPRKRSRALLESASWSIVDALNAWHEEEREPCDTEKQIAQPG